MLPDVGMQQLPVYIATLFSKVLFAIWLPSLSSRSAIPPPRLAEFRRIALFRITTGVPIPTKMAQPASSTPVLLKPVIVKFWIVTVPRLSSTPMPGPVLVFTVARALALALLLGAPTHWLTKAL